MSIGYGDPRVIKDEFGSGVFDRVVGVVGEVVLMIGQIVFVRDDARGCVRGRVGGLLAGARGCRRGGGVAVAG